MIWLLLMHRTQNIQVSSAEALLGFSNFMHFNAPA